MGLNVKALSMCAIMMCALHAEAIDYAVSGAAEGCDGKTI